ncbi:cysteine desulfurase family protein [uncultured Demequina sp.]|uniref:cysteine desulfurase family protein n=1 Tax=uncultured Demequina sp. TaxID=693499 RepID=UPI0025CD0C7C|nr:cysteine desulfurase family protein [uncultured Demequina sp.]
MPRHYLDHAATTPMLDRAREAYVDELSRVGNPSALHTSGRLARSVVEDARERMAAALGAHATEVIWTSGGTEADNVAIKGLFWARHGADPRRTRIVTTAIEHHAGLDPAHWLEAEHGATVVVLPVGSDGRVDLDALRAEVAENFDQIALVSVMWANNEVGAIQPMREIVNIATEHDIPVHADAVQAVGHVPVDFRGAGLATMAVSAHKFGGPVGVGVLAARRDLTITPLTHGGGQERKVRSGTLNAAGFHAASIAAEEAVATLDAEAQRLGALQRQLIDRIRHAIPEARLSGPEPGPQRLPGNVHFVFPGCAAEAMMFVLDSHGVEASNGSACSAGVAQASHVLIAMGRAERDAASTMRFSLGHTTTQDDLDALMRALPEAVDKARRVAGTFDSATFG